MQLERLIYVSESKIDATDIDIVVENIVTVSQAKNADLEVSGALLFTGTHFAQILEGPTKSIALILSSLRNDPRHHNIIIVARHSILVRMFSGWEMAYHGSSQYVAHHVNRLLRKRTHSDQKWATDRLTQLILEFLARSDSA